MIRLATPADILRDRGDDAAAFLSAVKHFCNDVGYACEVSKIKSGPEAGNEEFVFRGPGFELFIKHNKLPNLALYEAATQMFSKLIFMNEHQDTNYPPSDILYLWSQTNLAGMQAIKQFDRVLQTIADALAEMPGHDAERIRADVISVMTQYINDVKPKAEKLFGGISGWGHGHSGG